MYVVERIVGYYIVDVVCKYRIPWYGYTAKDDTYESELHIPEHFVTKYWMRYRRSQQRAKR